MTLLAHILLLFAQQNPMGSTYVPPASSPAPAISVITVATGTISLEPGTITTIGN